MKRHEENAALTIGNCPRRFYNPNIPAFTLAS